MYTYNVCFHMIYILMNIFERNSEYPTAFNGRKYLEV